jgi:hypothetical protein
MPDPTVENIPFALGFVLRCSFPAAMDEMVATLTLRGRGLRTMSFRADSPTSRHVLNLWLVRLDMGFDADMFAGELTWSLEVALRQRAGSWRMLHRRRRLTFRFDPSLGEVAASAAPYPPSVNDPKFGQSETCTPTILRFHVDDEERALCRVGSVVKLHMFPEYPPFVFNTEACVGAFPPDAPGAYTNPDSVWFNTFFGYYQLDCAKEVWSRPFGYDRADGRSSVPVPEDLVRLGKSDWNWFSNWDYGVPTDALRKYTAVPSAIDAVDHGLVTVGTSQWHQLELRGTEAASCYVAGGPRAGTLAHNTVLERTWRRSFGGLNPRPNHPKSFVPTVLDAEVYMAYSETCTHFHTVIFGGTMQAGTDPTFLRAQLDAVEVVMRTEYPGLGFPLP